MVAPVYATDLTDINLVNTAGGTTGWTAIGTGGAGLASETDYFIQGDGCVSKSGWTAATKGMIYDATTTTIAAGDALFIWVKQNNRNLLDTTTNGGVQVIVGSATGAYDHFYVDGSETEGSDLAGWRNYAIDPTQTPSTTTGSPTNTNFIGCLWKILGSGTLKGSPNGIDAFRHGRELQCTNGETANYATFDGAATYDADTTRAWGLLTPALGNYLFHGAFVMGTTGTAVDFRDSNRSIYVLNDLFVPSTFNEFEIRNASSNVEWTNIQIVHQGTVSPSTMTLNVGTFTGDLCRFVGAGTTTFNSNGSSACTNSTWEDSGQIVLNQADISGSSVLTPTVAADEGAVYDNRTTSGATSLTELEGCTFTMGTNAHHAIRFGTNVAHELTLTNCAFNGFGATNDANDSILRFDATSGSININLINCTVDGSPATTSNFTIDDAAGITVTPVINPVTTLITCIDANGDPVSGARVLVETGDADQVGSPTYDTISYIGGNSVANASTASLSLTHGLTIASGDVLIVMVNGNNTTTDGITDNNGSFPFTQAFQEAHPATASTGQYAIFYRVAGGSEPTSYTFDQAAADRLEWVILQFRNVDNTTPFDVTPSASTRNSSESGTTATAPSINTVTDGAMGICGFFLDSTSSFSAYTNSYTNEVEAATHHQAVAAVSRIFSTAGATGTTSATISADRSSHSQQFALKPSSTPGAPLGFPYRESVSITQSAGTATVTHTDHGLATNDYVVIRGAQPDGYNKQAQITVTGANSYTYSVDSGLSSPATGSPVSSYAPISGTTNASGQIQSSKTWPAAQSLVGWARKTSASPYYKTAPISVADASSGSSTTALMILDE